MTTPKQRPTTASATQCVQKAIRLTHHAGDGATAALRLKDFDCAAKFLNELADSAALGLRALDLIKEIQKADQASNIPETGQLSHVNSKFQSKDGAFLVTVTNNITGLEREGTFRTAPEAFDCHEEWLKQATAA